MIEVSGCGCRKHKETEQSAFLFYEHSLKVTNSLTGLGPMSILLGAQVNISGAGQFVGMEWGEASGV